jgi:hypothetical protein
MASTFLTGQSRLLAMLAGSGSMRLGDPDQAAVSVLQMALSIMGHQLPQSRLRSGAMDGVFGQETDRAVRSFQGANTLSADGIVGMKTMGAFDRRLSVFPLPPAAPTVPSVVTKVDIPRTLRSLKQPDPASCWAATATMLWEFQNPSLVSPHVATHSATERIETVLRRADDRGVMSKGFFMQEFKSRKGLLHDHSVKLFVDALGLRRPPFNLATEVLGITGWLALAQAAKGPIAADSVRIDTGIKSHWFTVIGVDSMRSVASKVAPPPPMPGLDFLNIGVLKFYDPQADEFGEMSIQDADFRLGRLPSWVPSADQFRARVFF